MSDGDFTVDSGTGGGTLSSGEIASSDNGFPIMIVRPSDSCW